MMQTISLFFYNFEKNIFFHQWEVVIKNWYFYHRLHKKTWKACALIFFCPSSPSPKAPFWIILEISFLHVPCLPYLLLPSDIHCSICLRNLSSVNPCTYPRQLSCLLSTYSIIEVWLSIDGLIYIFLKLKLIFTFGFYHHLSIYYWFCGRRIYFSRPAEDASREEECLRWLIN